MQPEPTITTQIVTQVASQAGALFVSTFLQSIGSFFESALQTGMIWWLYAAFAVVAVRLALQWYRHAQLVEAGIFDVDKMTGPEFEQFLAQLFMRLGYQVEHVGHVSDYGGDLVIAKAGVRTVVQAKRYKSLVGEDAVREAYGAVHLYNCSRALVVTNSHYSRQAVRLAHANNVHLWGRNQLVKSILQSRRPTPDTSL